MEKSSTGENGLSVVRLDDIHLFAQEIVQKQFSLAPVDLHHPLPERSKRSLGLVRIDGNVFTSDRLLRALILKVQVAFLREVRTIFLGPRVELDLPVFSSETILMGNNRVFFLDIQRRGGYGRHDDTALYGSLTAIRERYREVLSRPIKMGREIDKTFSRAACYVKISREQDEQAVNLFREYLDCFIGLVRGTPVLTGEGLELARADYDAYTRMVLEHDPAARIYRILFGKRGGEERVRELFFAG